MSTESFDSSPAQLMAAIARDRDRGAFTALYGRYAPKVKGYMLGRGMDPAKVDEVVQDAMLVAWQRADAYDARAASVGTWLYTIARNKMLDGVRREARMIYDGTAVPEEVLLPTVEQDIDGARRAARLRQEFAALPPEQAEVLTIAYYEGLSQRDIARRLELPLGTVKSRTRLALARLREVLDPAP